MQKSTRMKMWLKSVALVCAMAFRLTAFGDGDEPETETTGVYTWTGQGTPVLDEETGEWTYTDKNLWSNVNNWLVDGAIPDTAPAADSTVIIPEGDGTELTILCLYATDYTGFLTINRDVKLARARSSDSSGPNGIHLTKVGGTGKLTLEGATHSSGDTSQDRFHVLRGGDSYPFQIDTDLVTTGRIRFLDSQGGLPLLTLNGALKGDGIIYFDNHTDAEGIKFNGDTSEFTGSYTGCSAGTWARDATKFGGSALGSASASWAFGLYGLSASATYGYTPFLVDNAKYEFGQLTANKLHFWRGFTGSNTTNATVEVGALAGKTSVVSGSLAPDNTLRKVGATSTLEYTQSGTANGTVEAVEGVTVINGTNTTFNLKFAGTGATIKIARSTTTTTTVDSGEEDDESTPDVDESKTTTTTTTANIPASFTPGFTDELAGGQYVVAQETAGDVTYDVYTLVQVVQDSAGTKYYSFAAALAAIESDETGTLDKTITLIADYDTTVRLPLGYSLYNQNGSSCTVIGASGVGVNYDEKTSTYKTVDNSSATWTGAAGDNDWTNGTNWSTGCEPNEGTAVVLPGENVPESGWLIYVGADAQAKSILIYGNTTIQRDGELSRYGNIVVQEGISAGGDYTFTLNSACIYAAAGKNVTITCPLVFANGNANYESRLTSNADGAFTVNNTLTGTGTLLVNKGFTFNGSALTVPKTATIKFNGISPTIYSATRLTGEGTLVFTAEPDANWQTKLLDGDNWTGVCELNGVVKNGWNFGSYGNTRSTVRLDGVTGYMGFNDNASAKLDATVAVLDIASGGLTLNNSYHSKTVVFDAAKITGSGAIKIGTKSSATAAANVTKYVFTGDMSKFTGALNYGDLSSYRPAIVIATSSENLPTPTDYGQIIVAEGATAYVNNTWTGPGAVVVYGNVTMGASGVFAGDNGVAGSGTITYASMPSAGLSFRSTTNTSGIGTIPVWSGTVVLPFTKGSLSVPLASLGVSGSTIVVNGFQGNNKGNSVTLNGSDIAAKVVLADDVRLQNATDGTTYTFAETTGSGNFAATLTGTPVSTTTMKPVYAFTKLNDYTGTLSTDVRTDRDWATSITIGTVNKSEWTAGDVMVALAADANLTTDPASIAVTIAGEATDARLFKAEDGNLYVAVASVAVTTPAEEEGGDPTTVTTSYSTLTEGAAAVEAIAEGQTAVFTRIYGNDTLIGWNIDENGVLTKDANANVAKIIATSFDGQGNPIYTTTYYNTLAEAVAAAGNNTITLLANNAEEIVVALDSRVKIAKNGFDVTGIAAAEGYTLRTTDTTDTVGGETVSITIYQTVQVTAVVTVTESDPVEVTDAVAMVLSTYQNSPAGTTIAVSENVEVSDQIISAFSSIYSYDATTKTFTVLAKVASFVYNNVEWKYSTLAGACTDANSSKVETVTLLAAREEIDEDVPSGWKYNTPEASETDYGTLTKIPATSCDDGSGNTFSVPATVVPPAGKTLADAAAGNITYAQAYALGLWDGTAEGVIAALPAAGITISGTTVTVAFAVDTALSGYTVKTYLQSKTSLTAAWPESVDSEGSEEISGSRTDTTEGNASKFYRVVVTIKD